MKFIFMVCLFFTAALANSQKNNNSPNFNNGDERGSHGWKPNNVYRYKVAMRTLTSLGNQDGESSAGKWAGMEIDSRLTIQVRSQDRLAGRLSQTRFGHVHDDLPGGPEGDLPQSVNFEKYPKIERPFEVRMRNGLVEELWVSKDMNMQEENLLKGLLGGLQYDTTGRNLKDKKNSFLNEENSSGVYKKMEREVTGDCEVLYTISQLPLDKLQQNPELAPFVQMEKLTQEDKHQGLIEIMKTKNYARCDKRVSYNFGVPEGADPENSAHYEKNFMRRSTNYRIITDRKNKTIYSTYGVDKIFANPMMYSKDLGMVVSTNNMTLESVEQHSGQPKESTPLRSAGSLIYSMGSKKQHKQSGSESSIEEQSWKQQEGREENNGRQGDNDYDMDRETRRSSRSRSRRSIPSERRPRNESEKPNRRDNKINRDENRQSLENSWNSHSHSNSNEQHQGKKSCSGSDSSSESSDSSFGSDSGSDSNSSSDSSSSSSDSHDSWIDEDDMVTGPLSLMNNNEFKKQSKRNPVDVSVSIVIEIASEMQDPNNMPRADTLSKINQLVNWVSLMNAQQLEQASRRIESAASSKGKEIKASAQQMFLDAVAQSGTHASYAHIKSMILAKKIRGETAAQVVSVMSKALRYPNKYLATDFFSLALSNLVRSQSRLNSTILMSVTSLINMAFVDDKTIHNYYPSHYTGKPNTETRKFVVRHILSSLEMELTKAIKRRDDHQAQVYIAAIGNLGHPDILKVFAPYLERKVRTTKFLRQHMVLSLAQLSKISREQCKYTLFNIFKNEGDDYEVRVAAILELIKTHPTTAMLQQMAQQSHTDSSTQVRAAIKTAITYAAGLNENESKFKKLARSAKAAKDMLTQADYGFQLSGKYMDYFFSEEYNVGQFYSLGLIGSEDSILHKSFTFTSKTKLGGWMKPHRVQASISSISQLIELIKNQLRQQSGHGQTSSSSKYSAENIASILNIKGDSQEALQANLFVKLMNQERFFAVGQDTFENLPRDLQSAAEHLRKGQSLNYTKFYNRESVEIAVPTINGMMYLQKFKNPVYIQLNGRVQAKISQQSEKHFGMPEFANATGNMHLVYASDFEGKVGFYCPFGGKLMTAGIINKFQVNIPVKINADIDFVNGGVKVGLSSLHGKEEVEILHRSQNKYTSIRDKESTVVPTQHDQTKFIKKSQPTHVSKYLLGQKSIGMAFDIESESDSRFNQSPFGMSPQKLMNNMYFFWVQKNYRYSHLSVKYNPRQSQNNKIIVSLNYKNNYGYREQQQHQQQQWGSAAQASQSISSDLTPGSKHRQQQLLQKVAEGINSPRASLLDIGVQFLGQQKAEFAATIATASSPVDEKVQAIFFFGKTSSNGKQYQINAAVSGKLPKVSMLDFQKVLEHQTEADFDIHVNYGQQPKSGNQIGIQVQMQQTEERRQYIRQTLTGIMCQNQMSQGNNLMSECENATITANMMNAMRMSVSYQIDQETRSLVNSIYSAVKNHAGLRIEENWFTQGQQNKLEVNAILSPKLEVFNVEVAAPHVHILLKDLPVTSFAAKAVMATNPSIPFYEVLLANAYDNQFTPSCALDGNKINTFTGMTFDYKIGDCWHVAVQNGSLNQERGSASHMHTSPQQTTVLVRDNQGRKEVRINYKSFRGEEIQVYMKHDGNINVNGKQLSIPVAKIVKVWSKFEDSILLTAYRMEDGELNVVIDQGTLQIVSDGQHVLLMGSEGYRNTTRGLCGRMGNDRQHDLATPENCYMKNNRYFGATWAMHQDEQCNREVKQLAEEAKHQTCIPRQEHSPSIKALEHQQGVQGYEKDDSSSTSSSEEKMYKKRNGGMRKSQSWSRNDHGCQLQKVTQVYEENGQICITLRPLDACSDNCRQQGTSQMKVEVVCRRSNNPKFNQMKKSIENGENVQLNKNEYPPNAHAIYTTPRTCQF